MRYECVHALLGSRSVLLHRPECGLRIVRIVLVFQVQGHRLLCSGDVRSERALHVLVKPCILQLLVDGLVRQVYRWHSDGDCAFPSCLQQRYRLRLESRLRLEFLYLRTRDARILPSVVALQPAWSVRDCVALEALDLQAIQDVLRRNV